MKNGSGYEDPTASDAIGHTDKGAKDKFQKFLDTIYVICDVFGYHLENRLVIRDKKTGRIFK